MFKTIIQSIADKLELSPSVVEAKVETRVKAIAKVEKAVKKNQLTVTEQAKINKELNTLNNIKKINRRIDMRRKAEAKELEAKKLIIEEKIVKAKEDEAQAIEVLETTEDVLSQVRTTEENKIAVDYVPTNNIIGTTEEVVIADMLETHIYASTVGRNGLTLHDYELNGKRYLNIVIQQGAELQLNVSDTSIPRDDTMFRYNFNQSTTITHEFNKRYKLDQVIAGFNVINYGTLNITTKGN